MTFLPAVMKPIISVRLDQFQGVDRVLVSQ
jgi:hypothetical protein